MRGEIRWCYDACLIVNSVKLQIGILNYCFEFNRQYILLVPIIVKYTVKLAYSNAEVKISPYKPLPYSERGPKNRL